MQEQEQVRELAEKVRELVEVPPWMRLRDWAVMGLPLWEMAPTDEILGVMAMLMQEAARLTQARALRAETLEALDKLDKLAQQ